MAKSPENWQQQLQDDLVQAPADFSQRVMQQIATQPLPELQESTSPWWTWLAVAGSFLLGIEQLLTFIFSIWLSSAAN